jgi:methyl-accepting chemotaxis protein
MKWNIGKKIAAITAVGLLCLLIIASFSYFTAGKLIETSGMVAHTHQVLEAKNAALSFLKDAETGQRGFIITGEQHYLEPYNNAARMIPEQISLLRQLTADNPNQQRRIAELEPLINAKMSELQETVDLRRQSGFEAARKVVLTDRGEQVMDNIRGKLEEIDADERSLLAQRDAGARGSGTTLRGIVLFGTILAFALTSIVAYYVVRGLTRAATQAVNVAEQVAQGKLNRTAEIASNDELGDILRALNKMVDTLNGLLGEIANMSQEHDLGDIDVVIEGNKFPGAYKDVVEGINRMVGGHISVKKKAMACIAEFGKGNFEAPLEKFPGKKAFINENIERLRSNIQKFIAAMTHMSEAHNLGDIDAAIPPEDFEGAYRTMAMGVNDMVAGHISVKKKAMACIAEFGKGNFEAPLEKFPGKKAFINDTIEQVRANLKALIIDANLLVQAAVAGKLATRADASKHGGDFRKIVEGVNATLDAVVGPLQDVAHVLDKLAGGDLTAQVVTEYAGDFGRLRTAVNTLATQVRAAIQQIGTNAAALVSAAEELNRVSQQMSASAEQTAAQANVVSAASEQVANNVQTVATGADEMGASIKEIAKNTADATRVATTAVKSAEVTNETISKLGQSSAEIGQVIKVITSIAQQTNLLALNATIEAARAGEAGKGFAVVANEVKELAKETAKATEDISRKIEAIQTDTKGAVEAIGEIGNVIVQINDIQNTIASAVEEQSATTNEISRNLAEAARGSSEITKNISGVAEAAHSTTAGSSDTQHSAQSLERMSAELQGLIAQFKCA